MIRRHATPCVGTTDGGRWNAAQDGAKITHRSGRKRQDHEKARLGVAAEYPDRAGLPRRHITEHHTEVQMPEFDPIDLGAYYPSNTVPIREGAKSVLSALIRAQYVYTSEMIKDPSLSEEDRKELQLSLGDIVSLQDAHQLQQWSWSFLRQRLAAEELSAFALDDNRCKNLIPKEFWTSEYANSALSLGIILPIPLFAPKGEVVISEFDRDELFRETYDSIYNGLEPPYHKIKSLVMRVEDQSITQYAGDYIVKPGAKSKFDIELFLHEAFFLIYDASPMPKNQAELGRQAADAYEAKGGKGGRPSDAWIRMTIAKLWHRLGINED